MTAPDAKAVEAAIQQVNQQVKVTSDIVRAVPAVDAWLKHLKVVVDAAQAYLDAQKAERRPVAHCVHCGQTHERCPDAACVREGISMKALHTPTFNTSPKDPT